jgi:hypothetical protein
MIVNILVPAQSYLLILKAYHVYRHKEGNPICDDWTSIMVKEFDICAVDYNVITMAPPMGYMPHHSNAAPSSTTPCPRDPVTDFKKGIKHDPTLFLNFKLEQQWVSWQWSTLAQARVQDIADVLDPVYAPSLPEDRLLFKEKQKYLLCRF